MKKPSTPFGKPHREALEPATLLYRDRLECSQEFGRHFDPTPSGDLPSGFGNVLGIAIITLAISAGGYLVLILEVTR